MAEDIVSTLGFDASSALATLQKLDSAMAQFEKRLQSSAGNLGAFNAAAKTVGPTTNNSMTEAVKATNRLTTSLTLLSRIVFTQFIVRALSQLRNAFRATAGDAIAFQKQLALITTIDDSGQTLDQLGSTVRNLSDQFNIPLLETASGLYQAISNQIGDAAESQEFLASTAEFARATNSSLENSVDLLSGALKSYELDVSETDRVSSIFFKTIDLGRVNANELANSFGRVGPQAALLGVGLEEVNAAIAAISVRGSGTAESLTQVRAILTALAKPSDDLTRILRSQGFASAESAVKTLGFAGVLNELAKSTGGSAEALARLFPNVRGLSGAAALTGDDVRSLTSGINEMTTASANFSKEKFLQATATDAEALTKEINKLKNAFTIDLGQAILKSGVALSDWVGGADTVVDVAKTAGPAILGVAGAFGVARLQIAATRAELGLLSKSLGALSLVPLAIGAGSSLGGFIDSQREQVRGEVLRALEAQNREELKLFEAKLKQQRDLENAADQDRLKRQRAVFQGLNKLYLSDFDAAVASNAGLVANTEASLTKILGAKTSFVDALARAAAQANDIVRDSGERVLGLNDLQSDRQFTDRTKNLDDAQRALALGSRAQELANDAAKQLKSSGLLGDTRGITRALALFDKAATTGERSRQIAERIGNRDLENRAVRQLASLTDQQISAEERLTQIQRQRQTALDTERARQAKITDEIRKQTKIVADNTGLFDKSGQAFSATDQAKRAIERSKALKSIANAALSQTDLSAAGALGVADFVSRFENELARDPVRLAVDVQSTTDQIKKALETAFSTFKIKAGVDVAGLEQVLGRTLTTPDQIGQALDTVAKQAADLRLKIDQALTLSPQAKALGAQIDEIFAGLDERGEQRGKQARFSDQSGLLAQFTALQQAFAAVRSDSQVTQSELDQLIAKRNEFGKAALQGGIIDFGRLTFGGDIVDLDKAFLKLRELSNLPQPDVGAQESQLAKLEAVLQSNPSAQFQAASTAIGASVAPSERVARAWEQAAAASARVGLGSAAGLANGGPAHFANGGRGTDTVNAMLTPGEFVVNAKSSRRFYSQIQAMNAGHTPVFRQDGGSVDNSVHVGDVTVSGADAVKVRELVREIKREQRRGTV